MTDAERRKQEAERLLAEPLLIEAFSAIEREAYEALLVEADPAKVFERRDEIKAIRALQERLKVVIYQGQSSARKPPAVA